MGRSTVYRTGARPGSPRPYIPSFIFGNETNPCAGRVITPPPDGDFVRSTGGHSPDFDHTMNDPSKEKSIGKIIQHGEEWSVEFQKT
jgi:hypothetical protein